MSLSHRSTLELTGILNTGGGLRIRGDSRSALELQGLAAAANGGGGTLIITGCDTLNTLSLTGIASAGRRAGGAGCVIFED